MKTMSKRKRNKGKRQRQKQAQRGREANKPAAEPGEAGLYDSDEPGSDETPVASVASAPAAPRRAPAKPVLRSVDDEPTASSTPTRSKPKAGSAPVAKSPDKVPARGESSASGVTEIDGEDWGRFASLAAIFAVGSFVTVSVVAALWKGTPVDGQSVNVTTGLMGGVIGVFGALGTFAVGVLLMGLAATQIITPRPLRWPLAFAAIPALAVGGAWLTGSGSIGALLGGNLTALGILLGLVGLAGGTLLVAMSHGFSVERLRPKRESALPSADEVEVRPLASSKAAPVIAAAASAPAKAPEVVQPAAPKAVEAPKVVEVPQAVETSKAAVIAAPTPVADRDRVQPLGGGAPVAAPVAKPAPPEPERNVVRALGGSSDAPAVGAPVVKKEEEAPKELEVRILKRGVPVTNADDGEIQVAPHEGEIDEPRPYVPPTRAAQAAAPVAAPTRTVTFASADDGATASVAAEAAEAVPVEDAPRPMGGEAIETEEAVESSASEEWEPVAATTAPTKTVDEEELEDDEEWEYEEEAEADEEWAEDDEDEDEEGDETDGGSVAVAEDDSEEELEDDEEWEYEEEGEDDTPVQAAASDDDEEEEDDEDWEYEEVEETDEVLASASTSASDVDADAEEEDEEDGPESAQDEASEEDDEEWEYEEEEELEEVLALVEEADGQAEVGAAGELEDEPVAEPVAEEVTEEEPALEPVAEATDDEVFVVEEAVSEVAEATPEEVVAVELVEAAVAEVPVEEPEPKPKPAPKKRASRAKKKATAAEPVAIDVADPAVPIEQRSLFTESGEEQDVVLTPTAPSAPKDRERLLFEAGRMFVVEGRVAVSMLQKRFGLDFKESTQVMDDLQERGLIGPYMGGSRREILMDADTWKETVGVS